METKLRGRKIELTIYPEMPTENIGERISPFGKNKLAESLKAGDRVLVRQLAISQMESGVL